VTYFLELADESVADVDDILEWSIDARGLWFRWCAYFMTRWTFPLSSFRNSGRVGPATGSLSDD
jgi:hypothetical protein